MVDDYCAECHTDAHRGWLSSAHRFSSFNNQVYAASVKETRQVMLARDGNVDGSRWCAGCHDPVPLFSGAFGRADFDTENDPTSQAGLTCTACHAIQQVNSTRGNGDYTIAEPRHYPFAFSDSPALREVSKQLIKAKPAFHKATFLKPVHRTAGVLLDLPQGAHPGRAQRLQGVPARPEPLRQLHPERRLGPRRAQLLLPAQGRGALRRLPHAAAPLARLRRAGRSTTAARCRSTTTASPAANTGVPHLRGDAETVKAQQAFLDKVGHASTSSACARAARCRAA